MGLGGERHGFFRLRATEVAEGRGGWSAEAMGSLDFTWRDLIKETFRCAAVTFGAVTLEQMAAAPWSVYGMAVAEAAELSRKEG